MPATRAPSKSRVKILPEHEGRIVSAALEQPQLGARRLSSHLRLHGINASESQIHRILKEQKLQTRELRLKLLEQRHLEQGLSLSELQQSALFDFNPCLRERRQCRDQPGRTLALDAVDLGQVNGLGRMFLDIAIDPSCCLTFAKLSADQPTAVALLNDQALAFYKKEEIPVREILIGQGAVSGGGVDPRYAEFFERLSIKLTLPLAGDNSLNGFVERFARLVRKEFFADALRSQGSWDLATIQSRFSDWLEGFNSQTQLPGYPNMGRAPREAFDAIRPPRTVREPSPPEGDLAPASPPVAIAATQVSPAPRARRQTEWNSGIGIWGFRALNTALLCLVFYFGWDIATLTFSSPQSEPDPGRAASHLLPPGSGKIQKKITPLAGYRVVWDRNLFGLQRSEKSAKREKIEIDEIELAGADVGLKLVGTVIASESQLDSAILEVTATRDQQILREKQRIGNAVVELILRNLVVVQTDDGRRWRLNAAEEAAGGPKLRPEAVANLAEASDYKAAADTLNVPRDEVPTSPLEIRNSVGDIRLSPQMVDGKVGGVSVGRLSTQNLLTRIGLRTADVIKGMDDMEFASAEDLNVLFDRLAQGGDMTLLVERRGRVQTLKIDIN
jgi:type II secretory pathway component PulC